MTFVTHSYTGAVTYGFLGHQVGLDSLTVPVIVGAILGGAPDTFDWIAWKLGLLPRWWLYGIMHHSRLVVWIEIILIAPGLHVLFDRLIHDPVIPREDPVYDAEMWNVFGLKLRRRDIHWLTGEVMVIALTTLLLGVIVR